jgi:serine/threonine protein phosphatase PrpC
MNNGTVASFLDNSAHGEDAFVVRELSGASCLDVVLDGVTQCEGAYASNFASEYLTSSPIESLSDLLSILEQVNATLFQAGGGRNLLTTVSAALKIGDVLHVINVGDSPAYLLRDGEVQELTTIVKSGLLIGSLSGSALGRRERLAYEYKEIALRPKDRLILVTDGLMNNLFPEEVGEIIQKNSSASEAVEALRELVNDRRSQHQGRHDTYGTFREDDQTAIFRYFD